MLRWGPCWFGDLETIVDVALTVVPSLRARYETMRRGRLLTLVYLGMVRGDGRTLVKGTLMRPALLGLNVSYGKHYLQGASTFLDAALLLGNEGVCCT